MDAQWKSMGSRVKLVSKDRFQSNDENGKKKKEGIIRNIKGK
jgi:hypothetical protein